MAGRGGGSDGQRAGREGRRWSRWMGSRVMPLKLMFPRPVVQFLCRINAPSITPLRLVSGGSLNQSPNNTFAGSKGDGRRRCVCLSVSVQATVNFIKSTKPDTREEFHPHGAEYQLECCSMTLFYFFFSTKVITDAQFIP